MAKLVDQLNKVRRRMLEANVVPPPAPGMESWLSAEDVEHMWRHRTDKQKRAILHASIERVVILPPNPEWRHRAFDPSRVEVEWRGHRGRPTEDKPELTQQRPSASGGRAGGSPPRLTRWGRRVERELKLHVDHRSGLRRARKRLCCAARCKLEANEV